MAALYKTIRSVSVCYRVVNHLIVRSVSLSYGLLDTGNKQTENHPSSNNLTDNRQAMDLIAADVTDKVDGLMKNMHAKALDEFDLNEVTRILKLQEELYKDEPMPDLPDPYKKEHKRCILCQYRVPLDYKNVQLLSQFVSSVTGSIYGRQITGLCIPMQRHIARLIKLSRSAWLMPKHRKQLAFVRDPKLFDPNKSLRSEL